MTTYDHAAEECTDLDERDVRALEQYLTVVSLDGTPLEGDETVVQVVSQSGKSYHVDVDAGACECADSKYREPEGGCKHVRRARVATGYVTIDARTLAEIDVDPQLGANAPGPRVATSDGGIVQADAEVTVREAADGAEVLEADDVDPWKGPFTEYDKYGEPTGAKYYRCRDCGLEVHEDINRDVVKHRDGCRFLEGV